MFWWNNQFQISPSGDIYPCSYALDNQKYYIGNALEDIDTHKLELVHSIADSKITDCEGCNNINCCPAIRCRIINDMVMGDPNKSIPVVCAIENIKFRFSNNLNINSVI